MVLNSHISAYARCLAGKVCGLVRSTEGTSQGEDKRGVRDKILNTKVARPQSQLTIGRCARAVQKHPLTQFLDSCCSKEKFAWEGVCVYEINAQKCAANMQKICRRMQKISRHS